MAEGIIENVITIKRKITNKKSKTLMKDVEVKKLYIRDYWDAHGDTITMENMAIKNKITTGIGKALLITEEKSPSTSESFALCCGREIFCVPDRADQGSECNKLIANGAVLTEKIEDILEVLEH